MNENNGLQKQTALLSSKTSQWITAELSDPKTGITVPKGYNVGNEVASAIYAISRIKDKNGKSVLETCNSDQVMNEIRDMVLQGLSVTKKQVWPIVYDGVLSLQRGVYGTVAALGQIRPDLEVGANVLYEGDEYDYCTDDIAGYNYITNVRSSLENRDKPIVAAYGAIYEKGTGKRVYGCVMTMKEIQVNWNKSKLKDRTVQQEYPQEMAKRTLINRMCKMFVNGTSNTNTEVVGAFNRMTEAEFVDITPAEPPKDDAEKQRMLHEKSKGSAGLEALLGAKGQETAEAEANAQPVAEPEAKEMFPDPKPDTKPFSVPKDFRGRKKADEPKPMPTEPDDGLSDDVETDGDEGFPF